MAALKINCFLDEAPMTMLVEHVAQLLYSWRKDEIEDIDCCFGSLGVRMCVEFAVGLDELSLRHAEILDNEWNVVDADSAVLRSRLRSVVDDYNYTESQFNNETMMPIKGSI